MNIPVDITKAIDATRRLGMSDSSLGRLAKKMLLDTMKNSIINAFPSKCMLSPTDVVMRYRVIGV